MCAIFFFLPLLISWGAAVAVQWGTDWSKSVSAMHLSLSLSQNDFIIVWKKKQKKSFCVAHFHKIFFFQHCLWKIKIFLSAMHSSFYFRKMFLLLSGKEKKSFFFLIMTFHLWFWKKNVLKEKIYFFPQSNINFHVKKSTVFVFLNKKLYLRVRTVIFTNAFITSHFSKCFFLCLRTKCHWGRSPQICTVYQGVTF